MEKESLTNIGGNIESALKGDYTLSISNILKEAWQLTQRSRKSINISLLGTSFIGMVLTALVLSIYGDFSTALQNPKATFLINIITTVVLSPLLAGVEMFGVMASIGLKSQPKMLLNFLKYSMPIILCSLCVMMLTTIGLQLILPGIYLMVALTFTMPLIIEKKLSPLKAIIISLKATRFQWFNLFFLHLILALVLIFSLMPLAMLSQSPAGIVGVVFFVFVLSYLAPMYYHMKGIVYREIFGLGVQEQQHNSVVDNNFLA